MRLLFTGTEGQSKDLLSPMVSLRAVFECVSLIDQLQVGPICPRICSSNCDVNLSRINGFILSTLEYMG